MLNKNQVHDTLEMLDNEFTMDQLFERLSFIENVKNGIQDNEEGNIISEEDLIKEINEW